MVERTAPDHDEGDCAAGGVAMKSLTLDQLRALPDAERWAYYQKRGDAAAKREQAAAKRAANSPRMQAFRKAAGVA